MSESSLSGLLRRPAHHHCPSEAGDPLAFERRLELPDYLHERGFRTRDLWRAMHLLNELTTLSCVPERFRDRLIHAKDLTTLITVIVDDVVDQRKDPSKLRELARLLQRVDDDIPAFPEGDKDVELAVLAWRTAVSILRRAPRYEEFVDLWLFDMSEMLQCQRYNMVINLEPHLASTEEYLVYGTHNFNVKPHMTMDLMFSPGFKREDLGIFRKAQQHIQIAVQLVNDLFTLGREVHHEASMASYPIVWCLEKGLKWEELTDGDSWKEACTGHVRRLVRHHMEAAVALLRRIASFEVGRFIRALWTVEEIYRQHHGRI